MEAGKSMIFTQLNCLLFLILFLFLGGCTSKPKLIDPRVHLENLTGRFIQQVVYRECDKPDAEWLPLKSVPSLPSTYGVFVDLPVECADLQAVFADGRIAGTQQNVNKKYPFRWTLR